MEPPIATPSSALFQMCCIRCEPLTDGVCCCGFGTPVVELGYCPEPGGYCTGTGSQATKPSSIISQNNTNCLFMARSRGAILLYFVTQLHRKNQPLDALSAARLLSHSSKLLFNGAKR